MWEQIRAGAELIGKNPLKFNLPENCFISTIFREKGLYFPEEIGYLNEGDMIIVASSLENFEKVNAVLRR